MTDVLVPVTNSPVKIITKVPVSRGKGTMRIQAETNAKHPFFYPGQYGLFLFNGLPGGPQTRSYTLHDITGSGPQSFGFTVKKQPGGIVSTWLHKEETDSTVTVTLLAVTGGFHWKKIVPNGGDVKVLILAAGAGVTPMYAVLNPVFTNGRCTPRTVDVVMLYSEREHKDFSFNDEFDKWKKNPTHSLKIKYLTSRERHEQAQHGRINAKVAKELCPDLADRIVLMCGPGTFFEDITCGFKVRFFYYNFKKKRIFFFFSNKKLKKKNRKIKL